MNCFNTGRFSSVGEQGIVGGGDGGAVLLGQLQAWSLFPGIPVFVQGGKLAVILVIAAASIAGVVLVSWSSSEQDPMDGKFSGIVPNSLQQCFDK